MIRFATKADIPAILDIYAPYVLENYPKGGENKLIHVFSVSYPMYPESQDVLHKMDQYFKKYKEG